MGRAGKTSRKVKKGTNVVVPLETNKVESATVAESSEAKLLALDATKQKEFKKKTKKQQSARFLNRKNQVKRKYGKGAILLSRMPSGFDEKGLFNYFKQFGAVSQSRLARSKKTSNSMGYAFVCFRDSEVAKVVAETMDNYLMYGKLMKCKQVPNHLAIHGIQKLKGTTAKSNPLERNRTAHIKRLNKNVPSRDLIKRNSKLSKKYLDKIAKLKESGIEIDVFQPMMDECDGTNTDEDGDDDDKAMEEDISNSTEELLFNEDDADEDNTQEDQEQKITNEEAFEQRKQLEELIHKNLKAIRQKINPVKQGQTPKAKKSKPLKRLNKSIC